MTLILHTHLLTSGNVGLRFFVFRIFGFRMFGFRFFGFRIFGFRILGSSDLLTTLIACICTNASEREIVGKMSEKIIGKMIGKWAGNCQENKGEIGGTSRKKLAKCKVKKRSKYITLKRDRRIVRKIGGKWSGKWEGNGRKISGTFCGKWSGNARYARKEAWDLIKTRVQTHLESPHFCSSCWNFLVWSLDAQNFMGRWREESGGKGEVKGRE